jgi:predicted dehydrogenase
MNFAIVGRGFVADYYITTLPNHPELKIAGAFDRNANRLVQFCKHHSVRAYECLDALLADPGVALVLNLTDPHSHYPVSSAALAAGKHVYSEKPLAMTYEDAAALVRQARAAGLTIGGAPATVLGDAAQSLWRALEDGVIGKPRLVYAEMEDGMIFRDRWRD